MNILKWLLFQLVNKIEIVMISNKVEIVMWIMYLLFIAFPLLVVYFARLFQITDYMSVSKVCLVEFCLQDSSMIALLKELHQPKPRFSVQVTAWNLFHWILKIITLILKFKLIISKFKKLVLKIVGRFMIVRKFWHVCMIKNK